MDLSVGGDLVAPPDFLWPPWPRGLTKVRSYEILGVDRAPPLRETGCEIMWVIFLNMTRFISFEVGFLPRAH